MIKVGGWTVEVSDKMPQKIASAMSEINEKIGFGCTYEFFDYLGYQIINGKNHAVLAQQTVITGKDVNNAVVIVFNEKHNSMDLAVTEIHTVVQSGGQIGGTKVEMSNEIPKEAQAAFDSAISGWVGSTVKPFAYIGSQVTKGVDYIFAATVKPVVPDAKEDLAIVTVNAMEHTINFQRMLDVGANDNIEDLKKLGYAFTW